MIVKKTIGKLLSFIRYKGKNDPFEMFRKMESIHNEKEKNESAGKLLILPIRVTPTSNLFEGLLGYALKLRGYHVYCLLDGGNLNYSENVNVSKNRYLHTCLSVYEQSRFYKVFGFSPLFYQKLFDDKELLNIVKQFKTMTHDDLCSFKYKDIHVGLHAKFGLMRYLMVETLTESHRELLIEFLISALKTQLSTENAIKKVSPDRAILSHGCYSTWGTALEVLNKFKVESTVWGRGYIGNGNLILSHNESYLYEYINEPNELWENETLSEEQRVKTLDYYSKKRIRGNKVDGLSYYNKLTSESNEYSRLKEKVKKFTTNIGVYPNIPWDGTMFSGFGEFPTMKSFVEQVKIYVNKNPDVHFIIRAHPAEIERKTDQSRERFIDILNSIFITFPDNVTFIPPSGNITSYQVSEISDAALLFGSTLSLEFAVANHPVIQVGRTNTTNKGIVFESPTIKELHLNLDKVKSKDLRMSDEMHKRAIQYAHHWVFKKHVTETLIELNSMGFCDYKFKYKNELEAGVNSTLDMICDSIIMREPPINK